MKKVLLLFLSVLSYLISFSQIDNIDYFGLEKPGTIPQWFNPAVLELDGSFVFNAIYNVPICDEFYFTKIDLKENIYSSKKENGKWQTPEIASFSDKAYHDADPFFALGGNRIYFVSSRPTHESDTTFDYNIWFADKLDGCWSQPTVLPDPINTEYEEYFFAISDKGNAFFASNRPGGKGSFDIYKLENYKDGSFSDLINIGEPINSKRYEFDPYISPDEHFMIFSINNAQGQSDIFFSFKNKKGEWVNPIDLGEKINTPWEDFAPSLSPDNKYFFYTNRGKFKWVSIDFLRSLEKELK